MEEARNLGGSNLKAPSVQELAKRQLASVPPRYVYDDIEKISYNSSMLLPQLPVIDMEKLLSNVGDGHDGDLELERLHFACKEWGFFQVVNHGVSSSFMEKLKSEIRAFFDLPLEEKKKFEHQKGNIEGFGHDMVFSEEQKLVWSDLFYMTTLPVSLRKPYLFPKLPASLRDTLEEQSKLFNSLAISILCKLAKTLRMDEKEMGDLYSDGVQIIRMNYYPPCPEPDRTFGVTPHSDTDALTILVHLNETEGLQIRKDDIWVPVKPLPNALTVNIGDMMEILSNGVYRSIEHRAIVNSDKERLSLATFYTFKMDCELGPARSLVGPDNPPIFRRDRLGKSMEAFTRRQFIGKSFIDLMKVESKDEES
ncbi:protein SRG1-like [Solanum dulcamara]|uniref:protein SRG1-like n=1 Tax=Solanum dulcamara TaxID=45834 RepID=UPI0024858DD5|nr:protein SRG1-like [Solanum dulcamara]